MLQTNFLNADMGQRTPGVKIGSKAFYKYNKQLLYDPDNLYTWYRQPLHDPDIPYTWYRQPLHDPDNLYMIQTTST